MQVHHQFYTMFECRYKLMIILFVIVISWFSKLKPVLSDSSDHIFQGVQPLTLG
jgi:hypothetical protein